MVNKATGKRNPMISDQHYKIIMANADRLNSAIIYDRDFNYNYFGFKVKIKLKNLKMKFQFDMYLLCVIKDHSSLNSYKIRAKFLLKI